jgi:hypothetical protein
MLFCKPDGEDSFLGELKNVSVFVLQVGGDGVGVIRRRLEHVFKVLSCELQEERSNESTFAVQKKDWAVVVDPFFVLLQQLPKVLEFLFLLEGWAVDDEMVLLTMETTRLRGDLVRLRP